MVVFWVLQLTICHSLRKMSITFRIGRRDHFFGKIPRQKCQRVSPCIMRKPLLPQGKTEHGGTGGGIIGALAVIGLRLHGSDGRFRGWHHLGNAGVITTPADLCSHPFVEAVLICGCRCKEYMGRPSS